MSDKLLSREHYGEAFWRAHHEAWVQSELNQREYCEAYGIPLKAFGNWRAKFKAEPQPPAPKLLYRRGGLSHTLSHDLSHTLSHDLSHTLSHDLSHRLSHMTYDRPTSEIITRISRAPTPKLGLHGQLPSALSGVDFFVPFLDSSLIVLGCNAPSPQSFDRSIAMAAPSPAEINQTNFRFWKQRQKRLDYLLERRYFQSEFGRLMASNGRPDCSDLSEMLSGQISFYVFADHIAEASGKFAAQRQGAQQRRRPAANGMSRRDLVKEFAGSAENRQRRTKSLWKPYYGHLNELGLNPAQRDGVYEYNGKNGRLTISYRQFEKLVSELAPRKPTTH
jgi:hypothetical protein